jgi:hypothetical protein
MTAMCEHCRNLSVRRIDLSLAAPAHPAVVARARRQLRLRDPSAHAWILREGGKYLLVGGREIFDAAIEIGRNFVPVVYVNRHVPRRGKK